MALVSSPPLVRVAGNYPYDASLRKSDLRIWLFRPGRVVPCSYLSSLRIYRMVCPPTVPNMNTLNANQAVIFAKSPDDLGGKNGAS